MVMADFREQFANIDQIRNILFGDQMRVYETRLDQLEESLSTLQTELHERISSVQDTFSSDLRTAIDGLERLIKSQGLQEARERTEIMQQVEQVNRRLTTNINELNGTIQQDLVTLQDDLLSSRQKLYDEIKKLESQISNELEKRTSNLTDSKLARGDLAEMLFELGLKLNSVDKLSSDGDSSMSSDERPEYLLPEPSETSS